MIAKEVLDVLRCPACFEPHLSLGSARRPQLVCEACETSYSIIDGIPDLVAPDSAPPPGNYRTETLLNVIAGVYDFVAPVMSMAVWRCSPLRYIDSENRALGRARGGVHLAAPIGTGLTLGPVVAPYHDVTIIGVDKSWKMLRIAKKRLRHVGSRVQLIRGDYERLPLRDASIKSLQSLNGLHTFNDRPATLLEFTRCLEPGAHFSGTALIRSQENVADAFLERYERYGIYPMLRSPEFLVQELQTSPLKTVRFETRGAVIFFTGQKAD
ncbi:MAG: methyltransferase domain-containing protein [Bradymonadaceae bacterium]